MKVAVNFVAASILLKFIFFIKVVNSDAISETCSADKICETPESDFLKPHRYILYDVNYGEGFNLRRDVYMRMAQLVKNLYDDNHQITLVLPPWGPLYHWRHYQEDQVPWSKFFNVSALNQYVPVVEFTEFLLFNGPEIDSLFYLQYPRNSLDESNWAETLELDDCTDAPEYEELDDGKFYGTFWGYPDVRANAFSCVSVIGTSFILKQLFNSTDHRSVMIDRAEVILHPTYGDANYWEARISMQFSALLIDAGNKFREDFLDSNDLKDLTYQWQDSDHPPPRNRALGGPYLAVHLRRQDFVQSRPDETPSLKHAAQQIIKKLKEHNLERVFVASDAPQKEFNELKKLIPSAIKYDQRSEQARVFGPGGLAIIDQWICAHARYFIGSYESTFSFRIHEEREILGFPENMTFNRLCGDGSFRCEQPSIWKIVYT